MKTSDLFSYINDILGQDIMKKAAMIDENANGIQVNNGEEVTKVALGVSCNLEFLQKAVSWDAQVCLFHHGLGLSNHYIYNSKLMPSTQSELKYIFENELTVAGYHFALDAHPEIGNNAQIIKLLNAKPTGESYFEDWGYVAEFNQEIELNTLAQNCSKLFKHDVFIVKGDKDKIKRIGVCSGGAMPYAKEVWQEILAKNIDVHLTGIVTESGPALARENGFAYLCAGHYATETFGIKALGEKIKEKFPKLEVQFIEVWNEW